MEEFIRNLKGVYRVDIESYLLTKIDKCIFMPSYPTVMSGLRGSIIICPADTSLGIFVNMDTVHIGDRSNILQPIFINSSCRNQFTILVEKLIRNNELSPEFIIVKILESFKQITENMFNTPLQR